MGARAIGDRFRSLIPNGRGHSKLRFVEAVCAYARDLAADVELDDEESLARFLGAVDPIEALRSRSGEAEADEEEEPVVAEPVVTPTDTNGDPRDPTPATG
jgi:hypothetical protein